MDKAQAIAEMKKGKKLTHKYFTEDEWVTIGVNGQYVLEDGVECSFYEFWRWRQSEAFNSDWEFFISKTN